MTYDEAIAFFAQYGNVSSDAEQLRAQRPYERQLIAAVDHAIRVKGQPPALAREAMTVLLAPHWEHRQTPHPEGGDRP